MISISDPQIDQAEIKAVTKVLKSHIIAQGKEVLGFEVAFSKFCGTKYAVATNNGTSALHTALYAAGIQEHDEVITTPFTFVATVNAILMVGAKPSFVDIDPKTFNIDPSKIKEAITSKTKAILVVNLYGQPADFDEINKIARKHKLVVIEDAAQSVNASYKNHKSGSLGDIGCFSFYATKNISCGEGGVLTTNNRNYYLRAKQFINHGQKVDSIYTYADIGYNYRMTNISAAILLQQLKKADWITRKRQMNAYLYNNAFQKIKGIIPPFQDLNRRHVYHQYTIRISKNFSLSRNELIIYLENNGIQARTYYPKPLYRYQHINRMCKFSNCQNAELASKEVVSLPVHPSLKKKDLKSIIKAISSL